MMPTLMVARPTYLKLFTTPTIRPMSSVAFNIKDKFEEAYTVRAKALREAASHKKKEPENKAEYGDSFY